MPWKYGFKSIETIMRIWFTGRRPETFWNTLVPSEYAFEQLLGSGEIRHTVHYIGYGEFVAGLYKKQVSAPVGLQVGGEPRGG